MTNQHISKILYSLVKKQVDSSWQNLIDCEIELAKEDWIESNQKMMLQVNIISHDLTYNSFNNYYVLSVIYTTEHYDFDKELGYDDEY